MSRRNILNTKTIIIFIISILLLSGAGYFVWNNILNSKNNNSSNNSNNDSTNNGVRTRNVNVDLSESTTDTDHGSGLSIRYPKDWKVTNAGYLDWIVKYEPESVNVEPSKYSNPDAFTITSPDDKISVVFEIGVWDEASVCRSEENDIIKISSIETDTIANYNDYVFASVIKNNSGTNTYGYTIGALKGGDWVKNIKVGDQNCTVGMLDIPFKGTDFDSFAILEIKLNAIKNNIESTLSDAKVQLESDNFNIAKQIVQSLYVKK